MLIWWGAKTGTSTAETGEFHCPNCNRVVQYQLKEIARYPTVYSIKLFRGEVLSRYVECAKCGQTYEPDVLAYTPPTAYELLCREIERDLRSGTPYGMVLAKLEKLHGMEATVAEELGSSVLKGIWSSCEACHQAFHSSVGTCIICGQPTQVITASRHEPSGNE